MKLFEFRRINAYFVVLWLSLFHYRSNWLCRELYFYHEAFWGAKYSIQNDSVEILRLL